MSETVFLAELAWPEFAERAKAGTTVLLPLGSTEQHGRHMAMSVDVVLPTAICERVAREINGLVAPTIPYGNRSQPKSGGGSAFPGTLNVTAATFSALVRDILVDLFRHGIRRIVLVNGHYENIWPTIEGVELALDAIGRDRLDTLNVLRFDHWEMVQPATFDKVFPDGYPGIALEHASVLETSMMLALRPDLVDLAKALDDGPAKFKSYDRFPLPPNELPLSGVLSLTEGSSAQKGRLLIDDAVTGIVAAVREEFQL